MHGHGEKPFVCIYKDCERSQAKNGFPRKWNLGDHMKRVHNYDAAASEKPNGLSTPPPDSPELHAPGPIRTKRSQRTGSKATSKKATRSSVPQPQVEEQNTVLAQVPDMRQDFQYYPQAQWDPAQMSTYPWAQ